MDTIKAAGAAAVTVIVAAITVWWLYEVAKRLGTAPQTGPDGAVILDQFQRAKDILAVVLPIFTAAVAYWVGNHGVAAAEEKTATAEDKAESATKKLDAVIDSSPQGILRKAMTDHPEAFGD